MGLNVSLNLKTADFAADQAAILRGARRRWRVPRPKRREGPSGARRTTRASQKLQFNINPSTFIDVKDASALFRLLGDEARLRLLRVLARDRFNVTELTGILGLAQSGVSRHLGLLADASLITEERDGAFTYYRLSAAVRADRQGPLWPLLDAQFAAARDTTVVKADDARLQEVLRLRRENFDQHAGPDTRDGRQLVPGRSWAAWARALGHLLPPATVVDIGCGEGYLTVEVARWASRVVAVDRSAAVLARAKALAGRRRASNITFKRGTIERLPLDSSSMDIALLSQALHHASSPARAVEEATRVVREGGKVLVLDLRAHDEAWVREKLGDQQLGFPDDTLAGLLTGAGLVDVKVSVGSRRIGDPFTVLIASGTRLAAARATTRGRRTPRHAAPPSPSPSRRTTSP
jgi:SAM-dependent methyltransferase